MGITFRGGVSIMVNLILGWCHHCKLGHGKMHDTTCPDRGNYSDNVKDWDQGWDDAQSDKSLEGKSEAYQAGFRIGIRNRLREQVELVIIKV